MSTSLPAGFKSFPVSRYITYITIALPLIASLTSTKYVYLYSYDPFISQYHQFWRLLTFQLSFINESEVFVGIVLLYQLRNLERLYSSHKYLSLILVILSYNMLLTASLIPLKLYFGITWLNDMSSGPTALIFALLWNYFEHIPIIYKFELYGTNGHKITLSDQFLLYLLGFQLAVSQGWKSIGSSVVGWFLGGLISRNLLPGKNWRIPFWKKLAQATSIAERRRMLARENTPSESNQEDEDDDEATETRPLTSQFLDTFRR